VTDNRTNKTVRIILITVLILLLVGAGAALWIQQNYKRIIQDKLPELSAKVTDSMYHINADDVTIDLPGRRVSITNLELTPDTLQLSKLRRDLNLPELVFKIKIARLDMEGIAWASLLSARTLSCDSIHISDPVIRIVKNEKATPEDSTETAPSMLENILAKRIYIRNPDVSFTDATAKSPMALEAKGGHITLDDWQFELNSPNDSSRLFYAARTRINLGTFNINNKKAVYKIGSGAIAYDSGNDQLHISNLHVKPAISKEEFYRRSGFQQEIYDVDLPSVQLNGLDWKSLMSKTTLLAESGTLSQASIHIFMSRIPPPNPQSKNGKFPHQLLLKLKLPVEVPVLQVEDGKFAYTEQNHKTREEGTVSMHTINGSIRNITNIPGSIKANPVCKLALNAVFKGSPINATFQFMLQSKNGSFIVDGEQQAMDGTRMNDITRPLALAEMSSLKINRITFHIDGNEKGAKGKLTMLYEDLKVNLLEVEKDGLDKKDVTSFLTNNLLTFPHNPMPGKDVRIAYPEVDRDSKKSFFNLIWKTLFTGMLQTASRKLVKVDRMVNKRMEKQDAKRREEEKPTPGKRPNLKK
jgi:hypothetical protein